MGKRIMIDLETFGLSEDTIIATVGIVDIDTLETLYYGPLNVIDQEQMGRKMNASTVLWWLEQDVSAQFELLERCKEGAKTNNAVEAQAIGKILNEASEVWANGPDFDCRLIVNFIQTYDPNYFFKFWNQRCFRTMKNLYKSTAEGATLEGGAHNAEIDARNQARVLRAIENMRGANHG